MKALLIYVPSRAQSVDLPYGLLYVASSIIEDGHETKIIDLCVDKLSSEELMSEIASYNPDVIGFGAITSGYRNLKELSINIRARFPGIPLIAGGVISSISGLLLSNTPIEAVVLREGEVTVKKLLSSVAQKRPLSEVSGIAYKDENGLCRENQPEAQLSNMDTLPEPAFGLVDLKRYCVKVSEYMDAVCWDGVLTKSQVETIKGKGEYMVSIFSSRGCINKCSFCYRHMVGIRQFSPERVIGQMKYFMKEHNIHFFQFIDELTNVTKSWCHKFCDLLDAEKLNITYVINGARVSTMDEALLRRFKATGCIKIGFGYESGSQSILDYIGKGVTKEQNYEIGRLMKKVGLCDAAQIMIGFPPESPETIKETTDFLVSLAPINPSVNYILPFPKTKDWDYCLEKGLIRDEEKFILGYDEAAKFRINLTKYSDDQAKRWQGDIFRAIRFADAKNKKDYIKYALYRIYYDFGVRMVRNKIMLLAENIRMTSGAKEKEADYEVKK